MKLNSILSWSFGMLIFLNGIINMIYGNDFALGVFFVILSLLYIPLSYKYFEKLTGFTIPNIIRILLALLFLWISLAVGAIPEGYVLS